MLLSKAERPSCFDKAPTRAGLLWQTPCREEEEVKKCPTNARGEGGDEWAWN